MAGLVERNKGNTIWLQIIDRNICQRSNKPVEGWEEYKSEKATSPSWIKRYRSIEDAYITNISWFERKLPNSDTILVGWNVRFEVEGQSLVLQLPTNQTCSRFMKLADNIDFTQPVTISVWKSKDDDGKDQTALSVKQNGANVPQAWNKNNLPPGKKLKTGKWDFSEQEDLLIENMTKSVIPKLKEVHPSVSESSEEESSTEAATDEEIPF